ncbi:PRO41 protein [Drechmeria coniospora]|uniref:PRO41 protein n=1 Tax=Drechmeria coniospora TaxID=98403 RepID=A0A151GG06_DRECN|nr:PRO41 protein [Drechmeria coniospora]KYK56014.1 PRO41 protein [Drechmeria coniospora]
MLEASSTSSNHHPSSLIIVTCCGLTMLSASATLAAHDELFTDAQTARHSYSLSRSMRTLDADELEHRHSLFGGCGIMTNDLHEDAAIHPSIHPYMTVHRLASIFALAAGPRPKTAYTYVVPPILLFLRRPLALGNGTGPRLGLSAQPKAHDWSAYSIIELSSQSSVHPSSEHTASQSNSLIPTGPLADIVLVAFPFRSFGEFVRRQLRTVTSTFSHLPLFGQLSPPSLPIRNPRTELWSGWPRGKEYNGIGHICLSRSKGELNERRREDRPATVGAIQYNRSKGRQRLQGNIKAGIPSKTVDDRIPTMGRLIKNHWARLIMLTAAVYQVAAAVEGFFWPKIFWDFLTKSLDGAVKPAPILQTINLLFGLGVIALEWPLTFLAGTSIHRSLEFRLAILPLTALASVLMYQSTNPAIYYLISSLVYFWAYSEGEMICAKPWTLPQRAGSGLKV